MRAEPAAPLRRAGNHSISVLTAFGGSPGAAEPPHAWGRVSAATAPQTPGRAPPGWPRSVQPGPPHTAGNILGPGGSAHKRSHGAGSGTARAQPGQSAARRGHLDLRVPRCKPQQSQTGGDLLLCAKSSWTVSLPPELSLPTARRGARIWELFNASANTPSRGAQPHQNVCAIQTGGEIEPGIIPGTQAGYISPKPEFVAFLHLQLQDI